jgi:transcriptional antiterminator RfaH
VSWLVVRTQPNREGWAGENIKRQGYSYYLPRFKEIVFVKQMRRHVSRVRALFPSYLFVNTDGPWRWLTGTFGVSTLIFNGECPAEVSARIIDDLRSREDEEGLVVLPGDPRLKRRSRFTPGEIVKATEGPFIGFTGIHQGTEAHERERILLDLLGRKVPVLIGEACLESYSPTP